MIIDHSLETMQPHKSAIYEDYQNYETNSYRMILFLQALAWNRAHFSGNYKAKEN